MLLVQKWQQCCASCLQHHSSSPWEQYTDSLLWQGRGVYAVQAQNPAQRDKTLPTAAVWRHKTLLHAALCSCCCVCQHSLMSTTGQSIPQQENL